jgi:glycine cleavage system pyridoxal-binding protein P
MQARHMGLHSSDDMFQARHIGPRERDVPAMLETIGVSSLEQLVRETVPASIGSNVRSICRQAKANIST